MLDVRQVGRKRGTQIVVHRARRETVAFPSKIVVMGDGWQPRLRDDLGHRQAERNVHRNRQNVLRHEHFNLEFLNEAIQLVLELVLDHLNLAGHRARADRLAEEMPLQFHDLGVAEEGERRVKAYFRRRVEQPRHPITRVSLFGQNLGPLPGFQRHPVGPVEPG